MGIMTNRSVEDFAGTVGVVGPAGSLGAVKISTVQGDLKVEDILHYAYPHKGLDENINDYRNSNIDNINRGLAKIILADKYKVPTFYGLVWAKVIHGDGGVDDLGIISTRVVTTAGVTKIVDFLRASDTSTGSLFKFHGIGTGGTAEASGDTALVTELTTEYNPNSTRATGSQTNNGATVYRTVGTNTLDSGTPAITEHGVFSASSAGTLLDRSLFSAINLVGANGDGLQTTYDLTVSAGG